MSLQSTMMDEAEQQKLLQSIPKMEDFENNLENIQPLKGGRRAHALLALSQKTEDEKRCMIESEKARFENELKHLDEVDDPLNVYLQYLRWTIETFPAGNNRESELTDLLERASFAFQNDSQYASDARYLRCWLEYAKLVDSKQVFVHLAKLGIGQDLALYYEQYSLFYEKQEQYDKARYVLDEGVKRLQKSKKSTKRLEKYRENFNNRIEYKLQQQQQLPPRPTPTQYQIQSLQHSGERTILGHKLHSFLAQSMSQSTFNNIQNTPGSTQLNSNDSLSRQSFGNAAAATTQQQCGSTKFQVFADQEDIISSDDVFPPTSTTASPSRITPAFSLSRKQQENTVPVERFGGAKLPQKSELVTRPSIPKIDVFRDDASPPPSTTNIAAAAASSSSSSSSSSSLHPPEHLNQMEIDNNRDTTSIYHRTSTMTTIPTDRRHSHQRHDNNNTRHSRTPSTMMTSSSQVPDDGAMDKEEHLTLLTHRYRSIENDYIQSQDSAGNPETIAALTECLGPSGPIRPVSFEELRAARQVNRKGEPQEIYGKVPSGISMIQSEAVISCRIGQGREPTKEYTAETLGAMKSIGAILNKRPDNDDDSDGDGDSGDGHGAHMKRIRRTYVNENS